MFENVVECAPRISPFIAVERHDASSREMGDKRKLQAEIDRTLKKIDEGVDVYDRIYQKVVDAESQSNKEKYEVRALSCPRDAPAPVPAPRVMPPGRVCGRAFTRPDGPLPGGVSFASERAACRPA